MLACVGGILLSVWLVWEGIQTDDFGYWFVAVMVGGFSLFMFKRSLE